MTTNEFILSLIFVVIIALAIIIGNRLALTLNGPSKKMYVYSLPLCILTEIVFVTVAWNMAGKVFANTNNAEALLGGIVCLPFFITFAVKLIQYGKMQNA